MLNILRTKNGSIDVLKNFLEAEISSIELLEDMLMFINSNEIRKGEFEGNEYIIYKVDKENFILYPVYDVKIELQILYSLSINRNELLTAINDFVESKKFR